MFQYREKLSILDAPEQIESANLQIDSSGYPMVSWIKSVSGSKTLRFCRYDGSEWYFNDFDFSISKTIDYFNFLESGNNIYFLYNYKKEETSDKVLSYSSYSFISDLMSSETILDTGNIDCAHVFEYLGSVYFIYKKDEVLYIKNTSGSVAFPAISLFTFDPSVSKISICSSQKSILIFWSHEEFGSTSFHSVFFDLLTETFTTQKNILTIDTVLYSIFSSLNKNGDILVPDSEYRPFYCSIPCRSETEINCYLLEYKVDGNYILSLPFTKSYDGYKQSFSSIPQSFISVYGTEGMLSILCEDLFILKSEGVIPFGFYSTSSPGYKISKDISLFLPIVSDSVVHYLYVSDNIAYGYCPFNYDLPKINRRFLISDGSEIYLDSTRVQELSGYTVKDVIYDKNFEYPFLYVMKDDGTKNLYFFDLNSFSFISEMEVDPSYLPTKAVFDMSGTKLLFLANGKLCSYDTVGGYVGSIGSSSSSCSSSSSNSSSSSCSSWVSIGSPPVPTVVRTVCPI